MFKEILVSIDLADTGHRDRTIDAAVGLARQFDATLHIMTVVPDIGMTFVGPYFPDDYPDSVRAAASEALHVFVKQRVAQDIRIQHIVAHGTVYEEIMKYADTVGADLIVIGAHRPELKDYLLGPNAARVVRHANQSVLVVR